MSCACLAMEFSVEAWKDQDRHSRDRQHLNVVRPRQVGCWSKKSINEGGTLVYGSTEGLSTFMQPQLPLDLKEGYPDAFVRKPNDGASASVEQVLGAIVHAGQQEANAVKQLLADIQVVSFRNNLNKIFGVLANPNDSWIVDACLHQGVLFLDIVKTEERTWEGQDLMTYYGYKFESVCSRPDENASVPPMVDSTSEFAALVRIKVGDVGILMAAEVDMTDEQAHGGPDQDQGSLPPLESYLELKASKLATKSSQHWNLVNFKYAKWWLQSFLAGVPTIVVGTWTEDGVLQDMHRLEVATLPKRAQDQGAKWNAWQMLRFGRDLLRWMIKCASEQPQQHLRFEYAPSAGGGGRGQAAAGNIKCLGIQQDGTLPERINSSIGKYLE